MDGSRHGPDNGTKPGGERHRREAPSQAKFGYGEREALPQVRCAGKFLNSRRAAPEMRSAKRSHRRNLDVGSAQRSRTCVVRKNFRREAPNKHVEREVLPQAKFGRGERAALPHVCCAEEFH